MPNTTTNEDTTVKLAALDERIRTLEATATEIVTIRKLLTGLFAMGIGAVLSGAVLVVRLDERLAETRQQFAQHEALAQHPSGAAAINDLRTELRVLAADVRAASTVSAATSQEIRDRLIRLESTARSPR